MLTTMNRKFAISLLVSITLAKYICGTEIHEGPKEVTQVASISQVEDLDLLKIITYINKGNRVVNDFCEMTEERTGFLTGSDKPNCRYNASFINDSNITLYDIGENVRKFFLTRKQDHCKNSEAECGEFTIVLKLVDLINSIVHISFQVNNLSDLFKNVEVTSFYELFDTYISSLDNPEILANITLKRDRAISILNRERLRIKKINSMTRSDYFFEGVNYYVGNPIKRTLEYTGSTIGSTIGQLLGTTIEGTAGGLGVSPENKLIFIGLATLYVLKR
jgi:hypothetical protein